jgi:hypothetical protein
MTEDDDEISGKFVLVVSDMHVGSAYGLLPYGFVGSTGVELNLNIGQEYLWECWKHFIQDVPLRVDALIVNGDAIDGQNVKEQGRHLCEVDPEFQAEGAAILLQPLLQRVTPGESGIRHIYVGRGSRYHSGSGAGDAEFFAAMVHARRGPDGRHTRPWTHLVVEDTLFDFAHHQSTTIHYRSMPLEREIGFFLERAGRMRQPVPERVVIVRSHTHGSCRSYTECGFTAVPTPAWKLQDAFAAMSRYPNRWMSAHIGGVGFRVQGTNVEVIPYLYDHPAPTCEEVL